MDVALGKLQRKGVETKPENVERFSPLGLKHINLHGWSSFVVPETTMCGGQRLLRAPNELEGA